jgi:hypothetical protein
MWSVVAGVVIAASLFVHYYFNSRIGSLIVLGVGWLVFLLVVAVTADR